MNSERKIVRVEALLQKHTRRKHRVMTVELDFPKMIVHKMFTINLLCKAALPASTELFSIFSYKYPS